MPVAVIAAGIGLAGSVVSANAQKSAAKKASSAQRETSDAQIALQREQMARAEAMAKPYQDAGAAADRRLNQLWNYDPNDARAAAYDGRTSPGGPFGGRPGMGQVSPVYQNGAPTASVQVGNRQVAQVGVRPQPTLPTTPPPAPAPWQGIPANWTPTGNGAPPLPPYQPPPPAPPSDPGGGGNMGGGQGGLRPIDIDPWRANGGSRFGIQVR